MLLCFEGNAIADFCHFRKDRILLKIGGKMASLIHMFKSRTLQGSEVVPIHLFVLVGHVELVEEAIEAKVDTNLKCPESGETNPYLVALLNY